MVIITRISIKIVFVTKCRDFNSLMHRAILQLNYNPYLRRANYKNKNILVFLIRYVQYLMFFIVFFDTFYAYFPLTKVIFYSAYLYALKTKTLVFYTRINYTFL